MLDNQELNFTIKQLKQLPRTGQEEIGLKDIKAFLAAFSDQSVTSKRIEGFRKLGDAVAIFASNFDLFEDRAAIFNKMLGISSTLSLQYAEDLDKVAVALGRNAENYKAVFGSQTQYFKGTAQLYKGNEKLLKGEQLLLANLVEKHKLTTAQTVAFKRNTLAAGYQTKKMYNETLQLGAAVEQMGLYDGATNDLLKSLSDIPVDLFTRLTSGLGPKAIKNLGLTVLKANQLKMSMAGIEKTSRSFLDVQEKSTQELFLQEITGKAMLTDEGESFQQALTRAYVERDSAKQQELISELILKNKDGIQKSVLIQEGFADYLNMSAEEMLNIIAANENLNNLGATGALQQKEINQLAVDETKIKEAYWKKYNGMAGADIQAAYEKLAVDERLADIADQRLTSEIVQEALSKEEARMVTEGSTTDPKTGKQKVGYERAISPGRLQVETANVLNQVQTGVTRVEENAVKFSVAVSTFGSAVNTFKDIFTALLKDGMVPLKPKEETIEAPAEVKDLILTPSGQTYRTDPMDYIFAMKNPGDGGAKGATGEGTDMAAISNAIRNGFATGVTGAGTDMAAISNAIRNGFARINSAPRPISIEVDGLNIIKATELAQAQGGNYA